MKMNQITGCIYEEPASGEFIKEEFILDEGGSNCCAEDSASIICSAIEVKSEPDEEEADVKPFLCVAVSSLDGEGGEVKEEDVAEDPLMTNDEAVVRDNGSKPYECLVCGERFDKLCLLAAHQNSHKNRNNFVCDMCGKRWGNEQQLSKHSLTHCETMWHKCDLCYKTFSRLEALSAHTRSHTEMKLHQCAVCGSSFAKVSALRLHAKAVHAKKRPHPCTHCPKSFAKAETLRRHTRMSHPKCQVCEKRFNSSSALERHVKRKHSLSILSVF